jgi:hypothetical protein
MKDQEHRDHDAHQRTFEYLHTLKEQDRRMRAWEQQHEAEFRESRRTHPIPLAVRRAVLARAGHVCEDCGEDDPLTLHHLHYETAESRIRQKYWIPIFGQETPDDLDALCWTCHQARHRDNEGRYWRDPDEVEAANEELENVCAHSSLDD